MARLDGQQFLVTGPTRSGKSEWAEHLAVQSEKSVVYVATAQEHPSDPEWQARIEGHRQRRPHTWQVLEVPVNLAAALRRGTAKECWLVDSLGTWVANCLELSESVWQDTVEQLLTAIADFPGTLIFVAEETGWGVVPAYALGRTFRDRLGTLTRQIGSVVDVTYLIVAGYALDLSALGTALPQ